MPNDDAPNKSLQTPEWATLANLIGYTCKHELISGRLEDLIAQAGEARNPLASLVSVYYKHGHATLDHGIPGNIGWAGDWHWQCLYFGNVPPGSHKHGLSEREREKEAAAWEKEHGSFYDGRLGYWSNRTARSPLNYPSHVLAEVWRKGPAGRPESEVLSHVSRNPFHWVGDKSLSFKSSLHELATTWSVMATMRAGSAALDKRGIWFDPKGVRYERVVIDGREYWVKHR